VLVEALAAGFLVADGALQFLEFAVQDVLAHDGGGHHQFHHGNAAFALALFGQALTDHGVQVQCELLLLKLLLVGVEQRDDTLDGRPGVGRVNGREDQVPRVGGLEGGAEGETVANLADQDRVGDPVAS
jgi:hypothetical protein